MYNYDYLAEVCKGFGLNLEGDTLNKLKIYADLLVEWNKQVNLTAITDPDGIIIKHFLDSLLIFKSCKIPKNARVIDVGTGAGFPGMVMKIARPDLDVTLLDGHNKRLVFLNEVCSAVNLPANIVHLRAEEAGKQKAMREKFDVATARAVAKLNVLSEYCLPFVKPGGCFVAMKGPAAPEEMTAAAAAIKMLGGGEIAKKYESLPDGSERLFCIIKKISQTSPKYPRVSAQISKKPL